MKNQIKELRVHIDGLHQLTKGLIGYSVDMSNAKDGENMLDFFKRAKEEGFAKDFSLSYQLTKASNSLLMAKYWPGESLKAIGAEVTPDKNNNPGTFKDESHADKVTWLIEEINRTIDSGIKSIEKSDQRETYRKTSMMYCYFKSRDHLTEATFWLGEELKRDQS